MKRDVAVILLRDADGRYLLQHRDAGAPGGERWAFFGGGIDPGETPVLAVIREAREELECVLADPHHVADVPMTDTYEGTMHVFTAAWDGKPLRQHEGDAMGWFTLSKIEGLKLSEHDLAAVRLVGKWWRDHGRRRKESRAGTSATPLVERPRKRV